MRGVAIKRWAAWAPRLEEPEAWQAWAADPAPLGRDAVPDAKFLPAMLRRRCTPLSKILLKVAMAASGEDQRTSVRTVFASRHGSINESLDLLENVARNERISPAKLTHTVHNAQAGLFSIASGNCEASSSLAAREDTFACGFLEALCHLEREPERPVLFVTGDVPLAETFAPLVEEPQASYGVALLLEPASGDAPGVRIRAEAPAAGGAALRWPAAAEFLRFWLGPELRAAIRSNRHSWVFDRS